LQKAPLTFYLVYRDKIGEMFKRCLGGQMKIGELRGKLVTLKPLEDSFFPQYVKMFSPKVRALLHVSSQESEIEYLQHRIGKQKKGETFFYCIFDNKENKLIGAIEIRNPQEASSQLYSWLNEAYWGTGMYQEALTLLSREYFNKTEEHFYRADVDVDNKRSYHALKKHGFIDVGIGKGPHGKQYRLIFRKKS